VPARARPTFGPSLVALALAGLGGCAEEPSFQLRWQLADDLDVVAPLTSVKQCADVGIKKFRLEVRGVDDPASAAPRLSKDYACFPNAFASGDAVEGPTLDPGDYVLEFIGVRRSGGEWLCPDVDDQGNPIEVGCVRDSANVTVRAGELPELEFVVQAPVQCDDGVDNDRDGRVDGSDLACVLGQPYESFDAGLTLFQLSVGLLDNPLIEPRHVGIDDFEFTIDGEAFELLDPTSGPGQLWPWRFGLLDARLDAGPHTLELVALAGDAPLTSPQTFDFVVDAEDGAFVIHEFALGSAEFLAPIEDTIALSWSMGSTLVAPPCGSASGPIDDMRIRLFEAGSVLPLGVDDFVSFPSTPLTNPSVEAEGWLAFDCDNGGRLASAAALTWTEAGYAIEIEGRVGGVTCFASANTPLRPGSFSPISVLVPPVVDGQGMPPAGCPTN